MKKTKTVASRAALVAAALLVVINVFQLALAFGVPWGEASYGGAEATLPTSLRIVSFVAAIFWSLVILVVLRRGGHQVWSPIPARWLRPGMWVLVGLMAISCALNALTPSAIERAIWFPVTLVLLITMITVQITADKTSAPELEGVR